ncbi:MAG: helix-turn-helix domain-containing protein [Bacteroidota bacterium]
MTRVFDAPEPKQSERLLLLALADNANDAGVCWPSVPTLQRKCGIETRRGAEKLLARVVAWSKRAAEDAPRHAGCVLIYVDERPGRSNLYRLAYLPPCDPSEAPPLSTNPRPAGRPERADGSVLRDGSTPVPQDTPPPSGRTGEPSRNPHVNPQQHAREPGSSSRPQHVSCLVDAAAPFGGGKDRRSPIAQVKDAARAAVAALSKRDVEVPVAQSLVEQFGAARVQRACAWYDERKRVGKAKGPGLLVKAVRDDLAAEADQRGLLTYPQMLDRLHKLGGATTQRSHFEAVPQAEGLPLWRPLTTAANAQ